MKLKIRILATLALVALTIGLFPLAQSASAVSDCKQAKGNLSVVNNGDGTTSGTMTQAGKRNGTTQTLFTSELTPEL